MDHTLLVTANDLERYAKTTESERTIPELIYQLVRASFPNVSVCRIPYGDAVNQPGLDGKLETESAFGEYVPSGGSYWEIGTGGKPHVKATNDYSERLKSTSPEERSDSSFIFVTPRCSGPAGWTEPSQRNWLNKRKKDGWKEVRILDGVKLADWLREFPALGRWMCKTIGLSKSQGGLFTPVEHWEIIQSLGSPEQPQLPAKIFVFGRDTACAALQRLFSGETNRQIFFAESPNDVEDFVAGFLASLEEATSQPYANRCLFIRDAETWHSVVASKAPHILVAHPRLGLESDSGHLITLATGRGHAVVISICAAWEDSNQQIIRLRSPSRDAIETILNGAGVPLIKARELASVGAGRLSALIRHLSGLGSIPPYASWENAHFLALAGLIGRWQGNNEADKNAIEILLGKGYGEWIAIVRPETLRADTPLIQRDEKWRMLARGESWQSLGSRLSDDDLDRFAKMAIEVLGERDPAFELPKDERFAAKIRGKGRRYSDLLKGGIAESLALLGSKSDALSSCSFKKPEITAILIVRELLQKADWQRWAELNHYLPMLAEAAPDEFLDAVEYALEPPKTSPFNDVFAQEGNSSFGGISYLTGLLWALEILAWDARYLARVTLILGELAAIDPGGNWSNRPANSLSDIFLPWHLQTIAPLEKRKTAVAALLQVQPEIGWNLLLALLPHNHGVTSGCQRPAWREFIPRGWEDSVSIQEYWKQIDIFTDLAVEIAKTQIEKLVVLIERLSDLPTSAQDSILNHLTSDARNQIEEKERAKVWETLNDLAIKHTKFSTAEWAMPTEWVEKIIEAAEPLNPASPMLRSRRLFTERDFDLYEERNDFDNERQKLELRRKEAMREVFDTGGIGAVLQFARNVESPRKAGFALAGVLEEDPEHELLPSLLATEDPSLSGLINGYVWGRLETKGWPWVDKLLELGWNSVQKATLLRLLPFEMEVWNRATVNLREEEALYWKEMNSALWADPEQTEFAANKLLEHGQPAAAVSLMGRTCVEKPVAPELATRALLSVLEASDFKGLDGNSLRQVITGLQKHPDADKSALFTIEWNFLPLLDRFSGAKAVTLEHRLANNPKFFCEIIALVFRSRKDAAPTTAQEPSDSTRDLARSAYQLLHGWRIVPGTNDKGVFDPHDFDKWLTDVKGLTAESGHFEVAMSQVGQVLLFAPKDESGLWIHSAVARALDAVDCREMRSGFTCAIFNERGVHGYTHGNEERQLAAENHARAEELEAKGFVRFATAMHEMGTNYEREAEREATRDDLYE